jgi:hypothetical protein
MIKQYIARARKLLLVYNFNARIRITGINKINDDAIPIVEVGFIFGRFYLG